MIISKTGHSISKENITDACKWDQIVKGFAGSVNYTVNGKSYLNPITMDEIKEIKEMGIEIKLSPTKYSGTY